MKRTFVFFGTYTQPIVFGENKVLHGHGRGVHVYELTQGRLLPLSAVETLNPSFLTLDRTRNCVYAANEVKEYNGQPGGAVSAFQWNALAGELVPLNTRPVHGADPCHVAVDGQGRFLCCANYGSGSVTVLPIREDGSLAPDCCYVQHHGSGEDPVRQTAPHAHGVFFSPDGERLYVPDLGKGEVLCYRLQPQSGALMPDPEGDIPYLPSSEGPRHMVFHPSGRFLYINGEMGSTVSAYGYEETTGKALLLQKLSTLPPEFAPAKNTSAAIKLHPNGRLLYVSNRGHDSLATYRVDVRTGLLTLLSIQPTGGQNPRDFELTPSGEYLIAAHQNSDNAVVFHANAETGALTRVSETEVPSAICVRIYEF